MCPVIPLRTKVDLTPEILEDVISHTSTISVTYENKIILFYDLVKRTVKVSELPNGSLMIEDINSVIGLEGFTAAYSVKYLGHSNRPPMPTHHFEVHIKDMVFYFS